MLIVATELRAADKKFFSVFLHAVKRCAFSIYSNAVRVCRLEEMERNIIRRIIYKVISRLLFMKYRF